MPTTAARRPVRKAAPAPLVPVYDADGHLVGVVDRAKITPVTPDDSGTPADAVTKAQQQVKKRLQDTHSAPEQARLSVEMNRAAIAGLRGIHSRPQRH